MKGRFTTLGVLTALGLLAALPTTQAATKTTKTTKKTTAKTTKTTAKSAPTTAAAPTTAVAPATSAPASNSKPLQYYVIIGMTGPTAGTSVALRDGMKAAINIINAKGGINGRKVEMEIGDTQGDPAKAVSLLQAKLSGGDKPDLIWNGGQSAESVAMNPLLAQAKIISVCASAADVLSDPKSNPYGFTASDGRLAQGQFIAQYIKEHGYKQVGLFTQNNATGQAIESNFSDAFKAAGLNVSTERYGAADLDVTAPLLRLGSTNPQIVIFSGSATSAPIILKSRLKAGMSGTPFLGDSTVTTTDVRSQVSADEAANTNVVTYLVSLNEPANTKRLPGKQALLDQLKDMGVTPVTPLLTYALGYDSVLSWANGVVDAKSASGDAVAKAMENPSANPTFPYAMGAKMGYAADAHRRNADPKKDLDFIPISPIANGLFKGLTS